MKQAKRILLTILDGWGHGSNPTSSAIAQAKTPFVDSLYKKYPNSELVTYGEEVGLPKGQMGNSEVGHLNIGAGRIVYQELARINKAIKEKTLHTNRTLLEALEYAKENKKAVHLMGLVSDGGVHSHINHLKALCDICTNKKQKEVYIHAFTDGRDTAPKSGLGFIKELQEYIEETTVKLATVTGRYYAMDRDNRWERIKLAYDALVNGKGQNTKNILDTIQQSYDKAITDEFLKPIIHVNQDGEPLGTIEGGDVVLFFNFRTDRPRQLTQVLSQRDIQEHGMRRLSLRFLTMTTYDSTYLGVYVLFEKDNLYNTLGEVLSNAGKTQIRIAETEKYPHVTFFFSGGREEEFEGENRILVNSPKVATYDLQPEMSALKVTDKIIKAIHKKQPNFVCLNYANTDMVGHTGVFDAAIKAAETVDSCLERLVQTALENEYAIIIIADHGNSDFMINEDGTPHTAHTTNPVPCFYVTNNDTEAFLKDGKLGDIAPTILAILGVERPEEMTGKILLS